jgi:5-methylcytosine-specific restriction protein A
MSMLDEIKPTVRSRVIDLVNAAGIDVSDWGELRGGEKRAASNPRYCYEWSFLKPGSIVVLNLWYKSLRERNGIVSIDLNLRKSVRRYAEGGKGVWRARAEKVDNAIQDAAKNRLPVRVIINDGKMRTADYLSADASRVERRLLDPVPWAVTSYDWETGECKLIRGGLPGRFVDQFSLQPGIDASAERRMVSGMAFVRDAGLRARALDRAKGFCEYCKTPGFATADGGVFLETHHVVPLGEGGLDTEGNIAVLCPNHHREAHHGARRDEIRRTLLDHLRRLAPRRRS